MTTLKKIEKINQAIKDGKTVTRFSGNHPSDGSMYQPVTLVNNDHIYTLNKCLYSPTDKFVGEAGTQMATRGYIYVDGKEIYLNLDKTNGQFID